jgi:hypothetical protein
MVVIVFIKVAALKIVTCHHHFIVQATWLTKTSMQKAVLFRKYFEDIIFNKTAFIIDWLRIMALPTNIRLG